MSVVRNRGSLAGVGTIGAAMLAMVACGQSFDSSTPIATGQGDASIASDGGSGNGGGGGVGGGSDGSTGPARPTTLATKLGTLRGIAVASGNLYVAEQSTNQILAFTNESSPPTAAFTGQTNVDALAGSGSTLAWIEHDSPAANGDTITAASTVDAGAPPNLGQKHVTLGYSLTTVLVAASNLVVGGETAAAPQDVSVVPLPVTTSSQLSQAFADSFPAVTVAGGSLWGVHQGVGILSMTLTGTSQGSPMTKNKSFCGGGCTVTAAAATDDTVFFAVTGEIRNGASQTPTIVFWPTTQPAGVDPGALPGGQDTKVDGVTALVALGTTLYIAQAPSAGMISIASCDTQTACNGGAPTVQYTSTGVLGGMVGDGKALFLSIDDTASADGNRVVRLDF